MPFDCSVTAGSSDDIHKYPLPFDSIGRFLAWNRLELASYPLSAVKGDPNPSSQLYGSPFSNLFQPDREALWRTSGMFVTAHVNTEGWEMGKNFRIYGTSTAWGTIDEQLSDPLGQTTFFPTPHHVVSLLKGKLNSGSRSGYLVSYDDELTNPDAASWTYTFTISHPTDTFSLDVSGADSYVWDTLGWPSGSTTALSHTGEIRIHTEEWFVAYMAQSSIFRHGNQIGNHATWRWLALVDSNFWIQDQHYATNAAGGDKIVVTLGPAAASLERTAESSFVYGDDMVQLCSDPADGTRPGGLGLYEGMSGGHHLVRTIGTAERHWCSPSHYHIVDLAKWIGAANPGQISGLGGIGLEFAVRVKIVNRKNPAGRMWMSHAYAGAGWYGSRNFGYPVAFSPLDNSLLQKTDRGALRGRFRKPGRVGGLSWERSIAKETDRELIDSMIRSMVMDPNSLSHLQTNPKTGFRADRAVMFIDPQFPTNAIANQDHWIYAAGAMWGHPVWGSWRERYRDMWLTTLQIEEQGV